MVVPRQSRVFLMMVVFALGGCAVDSYTSEKKTSNADTAKDAGIGAATGTVVTAPPTAGEKVRAKGAVLGPVAAAPVSGGIGYYQDRQEKVLRERLEGTGVRLQRTGDNIKLIVPGNIAFSVNSEQIQVGFTGVLSSVALVLKEYNKTVVDIKGYTDSTGSFEHNQQLSERRAQSVGNYLIGHQVAAARIRTAGYGPRYPIAGNDTDSGRAQNRRVEINLVPMP